MRLPLTNIRDVAECQLCCGCGVCAYLSPDEITMVDTLEYGRRPLVDNYPPQDARLTEAFTACPGVRLEHTFDQADPTLIPELIAGWGPVREVWEGHASDPEIRFAGSSGGAASALAMYCIERGGMHGVLHIAARPDVPYLNHTVLSTTRAEIFAATGSRYAPASPCDGLQMIEDAPGPCVFIGKPCDVAAAENARRLRPALDRNLGLTIAIFCAGTPSLAGTLVLLRRVGVDDPAQVTSLRYRGRGWPGFWEVHWRTPEGEQVRRLTYRESWGELERCRQWRCALCADHSGEFADIAVGDPWYRATDPQEAGYSLVLARTPRGRDILGAAMAAGYLHLSPAAPDLVNASQPGMLKTRGRLWGRLTMLRLLGIPVPRCVGLPMWRFWVHELSLREKLQSFYGAAKRVVTRRLWRRHVMHAYTPQIPATVATRTTVRPARRLRVGYGS